MIGAPIWSCACLYDDALRCQTDRAEEHQLFYPLKPLPPHLVPAACKCRCHSMTDAEKKAEGWIPDPARVSR